MMRNETNIKYWILILFFIISCKSHDENERVKSNSENTEIFNTKFQGVFSVTQNTEETTTGTAFITYSFVIESNKAILNTNTYHEPIICNGDYKTVDNNDILELYYDGEEENCKSKSPNFKIKKDSRNYFIKGVGGEGTINEWVELKKMK